MKRIKIGRVLITMFGLRLAMKNTHQSKPDEYSLPLNPPALAPLVVFLIIR